jgi:Flp pilus assembly pilin Flp
MARMGRAITWRLAWSFGQGERITMFDLIRSLVATVRQDTRGISAMEYAILATGIVLVVMGVVFTLGTNVAAIFSNVNSSI